jgi:glutamine synthetase
MKTVIGEDLFPKLIEAKQKEWDDYKKTVTEWEIKRYMDLI